MGVENTHILFVLIIPSLDVVRKCLSMQLEELEIIASIFCGPREMVIDDPGIIVDMHSFIAGQEQYLNRKLDYRVYVTLSGFKERLEVFAELPHYYPALELPLVSISYPNITTNQHNRLKCLTEAALNDLQQTDETFLFQFISWIQDDEKVRHALLNSSPTATAATAAGDTPKRKGSGATVPDKLQRMWIYSHHIKSKRKRSSIIENARDLQLTGFSLPGKPGIICVEGWLKDTQEFYRLLKAMHWQRVQVRLVESADTVEGAGGGGGDTDLNAFRKFSKFEEETDFAVVNNNNNNNGPTVAGGGDDSNDDTENNDEDLSSDQVLLRLNMSTFSTFLEQHKSGHVMSSLFGFK